MNGEAIESVEIQKLFLVRPAKSRFGNFQETLNAHEDIPKETKLEEMLRHFLNQQTLQNNTEQQAEKSFSKTKKRINKRTNAARNTTSTYAAEAQHERIPNETLSLT